MIRHPPTGLQSNGATQFSDRRGSIRTLQKLAEKIMQGSFIGPQRKSRAQSADRPLNLAGGGFEPRNLLQGREGIRLQRQGTLERRGDLLWALLRFGDQRLKVRTAPITWIR
jgi:hypothetical protein